MSYFISLQWNFRCAKNKNKKLGRNTHTHRHSFTIFSLLTNTFLASIVIVHTFQMQRKAHCFHCQQRQFGLVFFFLKFYFLRKFLCHLPFMWPVAVPLIYDVVSHLSRLSHIQNINQACSHVCLCLCVRTNYLPVH